MRSLPSRKFLLICGALTLTGCGTNLPVMDLAHPEGPDYNDFVLAIVSHVQCELRHAVIRTSRGPQRAYLYKWAAKLELTIHVDEKGTVGPSISANNAPGIFTFAASGNFEADSTRVMTMTYYLPFDEMIDSDEQPHDRSRYENCPAQEHEPIAGHLGILQTMESALSTYDSRNNVSNRLSQPFDTITHDVTFQVVAGGTASPSWKYAAVSINPSGDLLSATRTRSDELLITMGPTELGSLKEEKGLHKGAVVPVRVPSSALNESFQIERLKRAIYGR